jgi:CheY-like chemotaxis protein
MFGGDNKMAVLHVIKGISEERSFELYKDVMFIGRAPNNDIQIKDPSISRRHAEIRKQRGKFFIRDLNSQNGTWMRGNQIRPGYESEIADGTPIAIGKVILSFDEGRELNKMIAQGSINMSSKSEDIMVSVFDAINEVVRRHGGVIRVSNENGTGAKLNIFMPEDQGKGVSISGQGLKACNGIKTVLVVDDDESILNIYRAILERLGYNVLSAENGKNAIKLLQDASGSGCEPDLVILDMIMPGMGGEAVFGEIKKIRPDIKVLVASGYSLKGHLARMVSKGCNGYIQKPFTIKELSEKIAEIEMQPCHFKEFKLLPGCSLSLR